MSGLTPPERKRPRLHRVGLVLLIVGLFLMPLSFILFLDWIVIIDANDYGWVVLSFISITLFILGLTMILSAKAEKSPPHDEFYEDEP